MRARDRQPLRLPAPFWKPIPQSCMIQCCCLIEARTPSAEGKETLYRRLRGYGVTSTCVMMRVLRAWPVRAPLHAHRLNEGYGLSMGAMDRLAQDGIPRTHCHGGLGRCVRGHCARARTRHEVVVTDHHECRKNCPTANAVVNLSVPTVPIRLPSWQAWVWRSSWPAQWLETGQQRAVLEQYPRFGCAGYGWQMSRPSSGKSYYRRSRSAPHGRDAKNCRSVHAATVRHR